jgi:MOSC N-terminal beta barrel domain
MKDRLEAIDEPVELPSSFYVLTLLMILTVTGIPLVYRRVWLFIYDLVVDIRSDLARPTPPPGCRKIGKPGTRNLSRESFGSKTASHSKHPSFPAFEPQTANDESSEILEEKDVTGRIEAIFLHPIKSTAPIEVQSANITASGLEHDRLFCFAQLISSLPSLDGEVDHSWVFITQRSHPRLALVRTEIWVPDENDAEYDEDNEWIKNGGCVILSFPFSPDVTFGRNGFRALVVMWLARLLQKSMAAEPLVHLRLPLHPTAERIKEKGYTEEHMKIWRESPLAWNVQDELSNDMHAKLKFHLGVSNPLTIFRIQTGAERELFKCAPGVDNAEYQPKVNFQDSVGFVHAEHSRLIR